MRTLPLAVVTAALAAGCTPEDGPWEGFAYHDDARDFLVPDVADRYLDRARTAGPAPGRLVPSGPDLDEAPGLSVGTVLTVVDPGPLLRVAWTGSGLLLLVYVDPVDMREVAWADTVGGGRAGWRPDDGSGVYIEAGTNVEVLEDDGDELLVTVAHDTLHIETWVPASRVDRWWSPAPPLAHEEEPPDGSVVQLRGTSPLLDAPLGEPFAWVEPFEAGEADDAPDTAWLIVDQLGAEVRGHAQVRVEDNGMTVVGWVSVDDVEEVRHGMSGGFGCLGTACGCGWGTTGPTVQADTLLALEPAGEIVALTLHDLPVQGVPGDDWLMVVRHTDFGEVTLWAPEEAIVWP